MRFGIIGAGWAATEHCQTLAALRGVTIAAVADPSAERAGMLAHRHGATAHASAADLLASERVDAIVVATPPGVHRDAAVQALALGLPVFLEKPLARTVEDARAIVSAAVSARVACAVGYQWRAVDALVPLSEALRSDGARQLVSEGVGVTQARSWFGDDTLSGRLIAERGSHHVDLQRRVGGEIVAVKAAGSTLGLGAPDPSAVLAHGVETGVVLTLHFGSGALGIVHVLWVPEGYPSRHRLTVFGTSSVYELELDPAFSLRRDHGEVVHPGQSSEHPFSAGLVRFVEAARRGDPADVVCSPLDAARTLAAVVACERALASGDTVAVERIPDHG